MRESGPCGPQTFLLQAYDMIIAIPDDYHGLVSQLDCLKLLDGHDIRIFRDVAPPEAALVKNLRDADIIVPIRERTRFTRSVIEQLPNLKLFSQTGRSFHHIDVDACNDHGIPITSGGHASPYTVAEHTWALIMASWRDVARECDGMRQGQWRSRFNIGLHGKTLAILGLGTIGKLVAQTGASFGMRVVVWGREGSLATARAAGYDIATSQDDLFAQADVMVVMARLSKETRGLVKAAHLAKMKPTSLLVNTARAELIEPGALVTALQAGRPGRAATDVYEDEPVQHGDHPLLKLENALCSNHSAWLEKGTYEAYFGEAFENAAAFAAGRPVAIRNQPAKKR
jgi:D-3-phosphoglycerate dehydrogenase